MKTENKHIEVFGSVDKLADRLAEFLSIERQGGTTVALSGGNTPVRIFDHLAVFHRKVRWDKIDFFWSDERMVPPDDQESNYMHARHHLLDRTGVPESKIHRIRGENDPEAEAVRYSREILESVSMKNDIPCFDLLLLGLGTDGHTASLFPDRLDLLQDPDTCRAVEHPVTRQKRITLTGTVINNAGTVIFLVTGKNKSGIIAEILKDKKGAAKYPAYHINPIHGQLYWLLDEDASADL